MKRLLLFGNRMKQYYLRNKLVFLLFLLGGALNTVAVTYCYGNLLPTVANRDSDYSHYREYRVKLGGSGATMEEIRPLLEDGLVRDWAVSPDNNLHATNESFPFQRLKGTLSFTEPYQILVPMEAEVSLGEALLVDGVEFTAIGAVSAMPDGYFIPFDTFVELGYDRNIRYIQIFSAERESLENDRVLALIYRVLPNIQSIASLRELAMVTDEKQAERYFILIGVNAFLSAVAFAFLLYYLLDSLHRENVLATVLGATKWWVARSIFLEAAVLSATASGLGLLLHIGLYESVFRKLNAVDTVRYLPEDYGRIYLLLLGLSLVTAVPIVIKKLGTTPLEAKRRYD